MSGRGSGANVPAPSRLPAPVKAKKPANPCVECEKSQCKNGYRTSIQDYACWCGGDTAPARPLEKNPDFPSDPAKYDEFIEKNNLPKPHDGVDRCCMIHDMELGNLRKSDPSLAYNSNDQRAADINSRLAKCFHKEKKNKNNRWHARFFASNGEFYFNRLSSSQVTGQSMSGAMATSGSDLGYGGAGASSAAYGAMYGMPL